MSRTFVCVAVLTFAALGGATGCNFHGDDWAMQPSAPTTTSAESSNARGAAASDQTTHIPRSLAFSRGSSTIGTDAESTAVLAALEHVLITRTEITKLRVEGHAETGEDPSLADARARAVVRWLVDQGVDSKRLVAVGADAKSANAKNANAKLQSNAPKTARAEFRVVEVDGKPLDAPAEVVALAD